MDAEVPTELTFTKPAMDAEVPLCSSLWRIDVPDMYADSDYTADDARLEAVSLSMVLRHVAKNIIPLRAYVYTHTYTEPHHVDIDGVIRRWREPSRFEVRALIRVLAYHSITEQTLREAVVTAIATTDPTYMDKYRDWEFMLVNEQDFHNMYKEDQARALADDI